MRKFLYIGKVCNDTVALASGVCNTYYTFSRMRVLNAQRICTFRKMCNIYWIMRLNIASAGMRGQLKI